MSQPMSVEDFADHLANCSTSKADAWIVCDKGVNGDDVIDTMLSTGLWKLSEEVEHVAGKRIRTLVPDEEAIVEVARLIHDAQCLCDSRYLMSCPKMAAAILDVSRRGRP